MIGQTLAHDEILEKIGSSRMRDVYLIRGYEAWPQGRSQSPKLAESAKRRAQTRSQGSRILRP